MSRQSPIDSHIFETLGRLEAALSQVEQRVERVETTLVTLVDRLVDAGVLAPVDPLVDAAAPGGPELEQWQDAQSVRCPSCGSLLKGIAGQPGDRCDWCGHGF